MGTAGLRHWAIVGIAFGIGTGCGLEDLFACQSDDQCGANGRCELAGVCSFPDSVCPSGRRYGNHAGDLSGTCVAEEVAGTGDTSGPPPPVTPPGTSSTDPVTTGPPPTTNPVAESSSSGGDSTSTGDASSSSTGDPPQRVEDGILVLYTFKEGVGDVVADVSAAKPPLDLTLEGDGAFEWNADGLAKTGSGIAIHQGSATKIRTACMATSALTLEAWVTSASPDQIGPARIVTYSLDFTERNFTLGEGTGAEPETATPGYSGRVRTTDSNVNGGPYLLYEADVATTPTHVVFTRDAEGLEVLYLDGVEVGSQMMKVGTFDNWDDGTEDYRLAVGNELTLDRDWFGQLHLIAVFDRALSEDEVEQNFMAGYD